MLDESQSLTGGQHSTECESAPSRSSNVAFFCGGLICSFVIGTMLMAGPKRLVRYVVQGNQLQNFERNAIPRTIQIPASKLSFWTVNEFSIEERDRSSIWGTRSASWQMECQTGPNPIQCHFSCDYPFSDWHELSICYRGNGWKIVEGGRQVRMLPSQPDWPIVSVEFMNNTGSRALLLFSLFDQIGQPVQPPAQDVLSMNFTGRIRNLLERRFGKNYGPKPSTFQVQAFVSLSNPMSETEKAALIEAYARLRAEVVDDAVSMDLG
jgi:hypothetical protein